MLILVVLVAAIFGAYLIFAPKENSFRLTSYKSEKVNKRTIRDTLEISGTLDVRFRSNVSAPEPGILESVATSEGDWVKTGEIVAVIKAEDLEENLQVSQRQLVTQTRQYERFLLLREQTLLTAAQQHYALKTALADAEENFAEKEKLHNLEYATTEELNTAREELLAAAEGLKHFEKEQKISAKLHELDKMDNRDTLKIIEDNIKNLKKQLENTKVKAPIEGQVVSIIEPLAMGNPIRSGTFLMEIADTAHPLVRAQIEEQYVSYISPGHPAVVTVSGTSMPGTIEKIGLSARIPDGGGTPTISLEIGIEAGDQLIIPGSTAVINLVIREIANAFVLPRGPYLTSGSRRYLYRLKGNTAERIDITIGTVTETLVQILSGVTENDQIITSSYQNYIDYERIILGGDK